MGWGVCERTLKLHLSRKDLSGKAKAKTGIGKSDLPGLQGGLGKRGHGGNVIPPCNRKGKAGNPPPTTGAPEFYPNRRTIGLTRMSSGYTRQQLRARRLSNSSCFHSMFRVADLALAPKRRSLTTTLVN